MRCPKWIAGLPEAKEFWESNWSRLSKEGSVDEASDAHGFAHFCHTHYLLLATAPNVLHDSKAAILHMAALKQYQTFAKQYGMMPKDRKTSGFAEPGSLSEVLNKLKGG